MMITSCIPEPSSVETQKFELHCLAVPGQSLEAVHHHVAAMRLQGCCGIMRMDGPSMA